MKRHPFFLVAGSQAGWRAEGSVPDSSPIILTKPVGGPLIKNKFAIQFLVFTFYRKKCKGELKPCNPSPLWAMIYLSLVMLCLQCPSCQSRDSHFYSLLSVQRFWDRPERFLIGQHCHSITLILNHWSGCGGTDSSTSPGASTEGTGRR